MSNRLRNCIDKKVLDFFMAKYEETKEEIFLNYVAIILENIREAKYCNRIIFYEDRNKFKDAEMFHVSYTKLTNSNIARILYHNSIPISVGYVRLFDKNFHLIDEKDLKNFNMEKWDNIFRKRKLFKKFYKEK